jgi:hypothetical protein
MSDTPRDPEYLLRGVTGTVFGRSYHLLTPTTVGRAPECDICLASTGVSRLHARLRPLDYGIEIEDLKSTNGSFLNGQRIGIAIARIGDEIAFDQLRFRVIEAHKPGQATPGGRGRHAHAPRRLWWIAAMVAIAGGLVAALAAGWPG